MSNPINRYIVVDQTTRKIIKEFKTAGEARAYIERQSNHGWLNYSVEDASWNVYDDSACEH